jgi:HSP20 family molecular chaperone IbpA
MLSQITPSFFPRSALDMDSWNRPLSTNIARPLGSALTDPFLNDPFFTNPLATTSLDLFDPFSDLDRLMGRNINWLTEPDILPSRLRQPLVPQKYRVTLDCTGYNEKSIKTKVKGNQLTISGSEGDESLKGTENYTIREFKRSYDLPDYVDTTKLVSFMTFDGTLVVEFPFKEQVGQIAGNQWPVVDEKNKQVTLDMEIPPDVDPEKLNVTCKDMDLIVRADYRVKRDDGSTRSRVHYLRRCTLPENTDFNSLKCEVDKHHLKLSAGLGPHHKKRVPIEFKQQQQQSVTQ